jgi:hypothetical protein
MFSDKELQLIAQILNSVTWKTGQSELARTAENIIEKINTALKPVKKKVGND